MPACLACERKGRVSWFFHRRLSKNTTKNQKSAQLQKDKTVQLSFSSWESVLCPPCPTAASRGRWSRSRGRWRPEGRRPRGGGTRRQRGSGEGQVNERSPESEQVLNSLWDEPMLGPTIWEVPINENKYLDTCSCGFWPLLFWHK